MAERGTAIEIVGLEGALFCSLAQRTGQPRRGKMVATRGQKEKLLNH